MFFREDAKAKPDAHWASRPIIRSTNQTTSLHCNNSNIHQWSENVHACWQEKGPPSDTHSSRSLQSTLFQLQHDIILFVDTLLVLVATSPSRDWGKIIEKAHDTRMETNKHERTAGDNAWLKACPSHLCKDFQGFVSKPFHKRICYIESWFSPNSDCVHFIVLINWLSFGTLVRLVYSEIRPSRKVSWSWFFITWRARYYLPAFKAIPRSS